jgi:hypothetical protein
MQQDKYNNPSAYLKENIEFICCSPFALASAIVLAISEGFQVLVDIERNTR